MTFQLAMADAAVRSTLECGGSTPLWQNAEEEDQGGVEPPHSKVLRTAILRKNRGPQIRGAALRSSVDKFLALAEALGDFDIQAVLRAQLNFAGLDAA